jgi:peptide/nickel transport system ATP-binding protein
VWVVALIATRVAVMYVGRLVEFASTRKVFFAPKHPYTKALLSAIPVVDPDKAFQPIMLTGEIPNPANVPSGCRFHTRCPHARERCKVEVPAWREIEPDHLVACHFAEELADSPR